MKKVLIVLAIVFGGFLLIGISGALYVKNKYNAMVVSEEGVTAAWSQVENVYQRRMDLIPNLVETVKGAAGHEEDVFIKVTEARTGAMSAKSPKDGGSIAEYDAAQKKVGIAMGNLLGYVENYPQLKANENFLNLQAQLEGTENRISVERKRYNEAAQEFNSMIKTFPSNMIAGFFSITKKDYFESQEGADTTPKVSFE